MWLGLPCTYWPVNGVGGPAPVHAAGSAPILVVGTTRDPATPYAQAERLARELDSGHLLTYDGEGHTAYGRGHRCVDRAVDEYLVTRKLPPERDALRLSDCNASSAVWHRCVRADAGRPAGSASMTATNRPLREHVA